MARAVVREKDKIESQLELKQFQLSSLLEITQAINQNFSAEQLYSIYKFVLRTQLKIKKMALFVADEGLSVPVHYGVSPEIEETVSSIFLKQIENITLIDDTFPLIFQEFQAIIPVLHKNKPLAYTLIGDITIGKLELHEDLIPFIQTLTNIIIVAIENKKFAKDQVIQQAMKLELAFAAQMQAMLIPENLPIDDGLEMYANYLPHKEIGGDYYDYLKLNDDEFIFCMADVSGKGIPAALLMANFQANLHALLKVTDSLPKLVEELNVKVIESARGEKFVTMFLAKYNRKTKELTFINSGHNPPLLLIGNKIHYLKDGTTGLGMIDKLTNVKVGSVKVKPDSVFLSYTDGVIETENETNQSFAMEGLSDFFSKSGRHIKTKDLNSALIGHLTAFKGRQSFADDITLLSCRFK